MTNETRRSGIFLMLLLAGFALAVTLNLNGSSTGFWAGILKEPATAGARLLFSPRQDRSDEWLVWTPAMLAQVNHEPPFPVENLALGAGKSPLIMSMPVKHYSMFFRPQLYGFFLFGADRAFAWYWNMKVFGLLAAMFVLFRRLLDGSFLFSVFGSFVVFSSSYTQWWFSCPPMLPEMLACWALAIVCVITLSTATRLLSGALACTGLVLAAVNFTLCVYPPYQIPLLYLGAAVVAGWFWEKRGSESSALSLGAKRVFFTLAGVLIAAVLTPFFFECSETLKAVASTSYPGARRRYGGDLSIFQLFGGLTGPLLTAKNFPKQFSNPCGAANFYPLWLAAAPLGLCAGREIAGRGKLPACILSALLFFALYAVCPLPHWIGKVSLLDFSTEERLLLPIGIANILLMLLVLHRVDFEKRNPWFNLGIFILSLGATGGALWLGSRSSPEFFTVQTWLALLAIAVALFATFLWCRPRVFGAVLVLALLPALTVNPLMHTLAPLTQSSALEPVRSIARNDLDARWVVYESGFLASFLMAAGVPVISGAKTVADSAFYQAIDPTGKSRDIYNRYAISVFALPKSREEAEFKLVNFCGHQDFIHPTHPGLRQTGVKFFVFPRDLEKPEDEGLIPVLALEENRIWIYRLR